MDQAPKPRRASREALAELFALIDETLDGYEEFWSSTRPASVEVIAQPAAEVFDSPAEFQAAVTDAYISMAGGVQAALDATHRLVDNTGAARVVPLEHADGCVCTLCAFPAGVPADEGDPWLAAAPAFDPPAGPKPARPDAT